MCKKHLQSAISMQSAKALKGDAFHGLNERMAMSHSTDHGQAARFGFSVWFFD